MYMRVIHHHPALGKGQQLRAVIEELVQARNARGDRNGLYMSMLTEEPDLIHAVMHEDFAAMQAHIEANQSDKDMQAYAPKMQALVSRFPAQELYEVVAQERSEKPVNFVWLNTFTPVRGAVAELRDILSERVSTSVQRGSSGAVLFQRLYGPDGPSFGLNIGVEDLATLESYTKAMQADPATQKWGEAMAKASVGAPTPLLARTLIPIPPPA